MPAQEMKASQGANYDANGEGLRGYSVVRNDNGEEVFVKHISFDK
jgi:hypothetical protein